MVDEQYFSGKLTAESVRRSWESIEPPTMSLPEWFALEHNRPMRTANQANIRGYWDYVSLVLSGESLRPLQEEPSPFGSISETEALLARLRAAGWMIVSPGCVGLPRDEAEANAMSLVSDSYINSGLPSGR